MLGPEYMNGRRTADHKDYSAFNHTNYALVSEGLGGGWVRAQGGDDLGGVDQLT